MSKELEHADVIIHMAKHGFESVERLLPSGDWVHGFWHCNPITDPDDKWRIKPATITYTVTVPEPMRVKPCKGQVYYFITSTNFHSESWYDDYLDIDRFKLGNIWDTEAKAQTAFNAIFSPLKATK